MRVFTIGYETKNHNMKAVVVAPTQQEAEGKVKNCYGFEKITNITEHNTDDGPVIVSDHGWHKRSFS